MTIFFLAASSPFFLYFHFLVRCNLFYWVRYCFIWTSLFFPVVLQIQHPLLQALISRLLTQLLFLEHGNGRNNGRAESSHSADLYSYKYRCELAGRLPKVIMLILTENGLEVQILYLGRRREIYSPTTKKVASILWKQEKKSV